MQILDKISQSDKDKILSAKKIAVAVSGGADSVALALIVKEIVKNHNTEITALTVDHTLRKNSTQEALTTAKWMSDNNIPHQILTWAQSDKPQSNIQHNARNARYELLTDYCKKNNIKLLLVAHNLEDQAETVLLRIMRGSGVDGLAAIAHESCINGVEVLRPFLKISKDDIKNYLTHAGQDWAEDPSNKDEKYMRVVVRNFLNASKDKSLLINRLNETATNIAQSKSYIQEKVAQDMAKAVKVHKAGYVTINKNEFNNLHPEAIHKILAKCIKIVGANYYKPRFEKLKNLSNVIKNKPYFSETLGGCEIWQSKRKGEENLIYISREISKIQAKIKIENDKNSYIWDERFEVKFHKKDLEGNYTIENISSEDIKKIKNNLPKKILKTMACVKKNNVMIATPHLGFYESEDLLRLIEINFNSQA